MISLRFELVDMSVVSLLLVNLVVSFVVRLDVVVVVS